MMRKLRFGIQLVCVGYAVALAIYLLLRLVVGDGVWWLGLLNNFAPYFFVPLMPLLVLVLVTRSGVRVGLALAVLLVIGGVWFGGRFMPKARVQAAGDTLKIISFNVWGDNPHLDDVQAWLREQNADIVLMQEIPPTWSGDGVPELLDLYPHQASQSAELRYWGQAAISRYPLESVEDFDLEGDGTGSHQRLVINVDGQQIAVYNVHFEMPVREGARFYVPIDHHAVDLALRYDDTRRNGQINRLLPLLDAEALPYLVVGDFNMSDDAVIYSVFAERMGDSFHEAGTGLGASWPVASVAGLPSFVPLLLRIDYVWHSEEFRTVSAQLGDPLGSDHLPLVVELTIPETDS